MQGPYFKFGCHLCAHCRCAEQLRDHLPIKQGRPKSSLLDFLLIKIELLQLLLFVILVMVTVIAHCFLFYLNKPHMENILLPGHQKIFPCMTDLPDTRCYQQQIKQS